MNRRNNLEGIRALIIIYNFIRRVYIKIFSLKYLEVINKYILLLALSAKGYNNYINLKESGELFFIKKYLSGKSTKLCFDIGANKGEYSKLLLEETNAHVVSFEPLDFMYKELKNNLSDYKDRVTLVNKGVGSRNENLTINFNKQESVWASFVEEVKEFDIISNNLSKEIEVISIDSYCQENNIKEIDLIKIDVEGFEKEVFEGSFKTFKNIKPKFVQIEFNTHQIFSNTTIKYFSDKLLNYDVYQLVYNGIKKVNPIDPFANIYMYSNFVFMRKDIH